MTIEEFWAKLKAAGFTRRSFTGHTWVMEGPSGKIATIRDPAAFSFEERGTICRDWLKRETLS